MKLHNLLSLALVAATATTSAWAQDACTPCQPAYRIQYKTIYEEVPVTTYRWQVENLLEERQVTSYRGEWVTENRVKRYRVAKPVTETSTREERYTVLKPVYETEEQERVYDKTTYVTETATRQERYLVQKPVYETQMQEQRQVVRKAVNETVMQQSQALAYEPVTTYRTQLVDQGGFVDQAAYVPGTTRNRLSWVPGGYAADTTTGTVFRHRAGLHCVPFQTPGAVVTQRVYVPNVVAQQIPQTTYTAKVVTQETPVNVTRYVDEVVSQQVPVQTMRMEQVEEVRDVPYTVQRPVTERIVEKVPVQRVRWEQQEVVREVPVTTQRIEYEEREEEVPVQVYKVIPEVKTVQVPKAVGQWVAVQSKRTVARVVAQRVPVDVVVERPAYEVERPIIEEPAPTLPPILSVPAPRASSRKIVPVPPEPETRIVPKKNGKNGNGANAKPGITPEEAEKARQKLELEGPQNDDET
jgi:hypothetical protein